MHRSHSFPLFFVAVAAILLLSCKEEDVPTGPEPPVVPDTTSHDFVWEKTQIGVRHTSLYDVEAISPDDVWVCGDMHFNDTDTYDSLGNWIIPYNAAHWDGEDWLFQRIKWPGDLPLVLEPIDEIKSFGANDVWFCAGSKLAHWNGEAFQYWSFDPFMLDGAIRRMDGTPGNLYFGGTNGAMAKFNGSSFTKINTGTDKDIKDIYTAGGVTTAICSNGIWSPAYETLILRMDGNHARQYSDSMLYIGMMSVWYQDTSRMFICGPGFREYRNGEWSVHTLPERNFLNCVRGLGSNDIFVTGHIGTIQHYNGASWKHYTNAADNGEMLFTRISYIPGHVYLIGNDRAGINFVYHGRRVVQ